MFYQVTSKSIDGYSAFVEKSNRYISDLRVIDILLCALFRDVKVVSKTYEQDCEDESFSGMNSFVLDKKNSDGSVTRRVFTRVPKDEEEYHEPEDFLA